MSAILPQLLVETHPGPLAPASPAHSQARYRSLDALRGIAAMVVVIHHSMMTLPAWSDSVLHGARSSTLTIILGTPPLSVLWAGDAAVKVFFALSGFVLALMFLRPDPPSYVAFAAKRVCRIYLPYIAVVAMAMLIMSAIAPHPKPELSEWFNSSWNRRVTWSLILDHALMLGQQQYNFVDNPIWSLVHEMRYSLLFPMIMWAVLRMGWRVLIAASLMVSLGAMGLLSHVADHWAWAVDSLQYAFLFVTGATLAKYRNETVAWFRTLPPALRSAIGVTALLLLGTHGLVHSRVQIVRVLSSVAPQFGAILLLIGVIGSSRAQTALETKPCLWAGRVSYSLYLSHLVLLLTLVSLLYRFVPVYVILLAMPPLALALAGVLYWLLEQPAMSLGRRLERRVDMNSDFRSQDKMAAASAALGR
jgi:peptidoglycan/LPS O-acetylase OafA/YrhL